MMEMAAVTAGTTKHVQVICTQLQSDRRNPQDIDT